MHMYPKNYALLYNAKLFYRRPSAIVGWGGACPGVDIMESGSRMPEIAASHYLLAPTRIQVVRYLPPE